jgi:hypothetical protein
VDVTGSSLVLLHSFWYVPITYYYILLLLLQIGDLWRVFDIW